MMQQAWRGVAVVCTVVGISVEAYLQEIADLPPPPSSSSQSCSGRPTSQRPGPSDVASFASAVETKCSTANPVVMLSFAAHPTSDLRVLFLCPQLYVYSDEFARLGREFGEPTREWYASAIDAALLNMNDYRKEHAFNIRTETEALAAAQVVRSRLVDVVVPLLGRIHNADDLCTLHEEHEYRLHMARDTVVKEWIARYRASKVGVRFELDGHV